jgi:cold shock CspA family protein
MEIGTIQSSDQGGGIIARSGNIAIRFNADRIIGRDRKGLNQGDQVWFEVESADNSLVAINIRKFHG